MVETESENRIPVVAVTIAAITAVAFWSLKPIFISMIGDRGDYAEVYVVAGSISVVTSAVISILLWRRVVQICRGGRRSLMGLGNACLSGLFLALWYYGFYRALYGADKADATIIAFTWPMIAVIAMRIFSPSTAGKLKWHQWLLIVAAFTGAVAVGLSNLGVVAQNPGSSNEIVWAFVAALGSGLYLPFAINATNAFDRSVHSRPVATFFSISVANIAALAAVWIALQGTGHKLRFYAFDAQVIGICALIGIGTYLIAEVTWTWAFREYKSLTLSSLPYFSPAVSVVLLFLLFDEPIRPIAILGLVVILFSNLTLHARHRSTNALSLTLIATVFIALSAQVLPTKVDGPIEAMAAAVTGLFAILAGFILSRAADRRTSEVDVRATLVRRLIALDDSQEHDVADRLLRKLLELEFEQVPERREERELAFYRDLGEVDSDPDNRNQAVDAFTTWYTIHRDRLSMGEWAALWITGVGSVLFVLLLRGDSVLGNIGAVLFSAGALLAIFTIYDYDRNNIHGFSGRLGRLQQGFREIGKLPYIPNEILESGEISQKMVNVPIRTSVSADDDSTREAQIPTGARTFNFLYMSIAVLVIVGVLVLPLTGVGRLGGDLVEGPRPMSAAEPGREQLDGTTPILIANPGWAAASVISEVVKATLAPSHGAVRIERVDQAVLDQNFGRDGRYSIHPDLWVLNQGPGLRGRINDGEVLTNPDYYLGTQGIYAFGPSRTRVKTWEQLRDPAIAARFDTDGDGRAEVWIGARSWPSTHTLQRWFAARPDLRVQTEIYSETIFRARLAKEAQKPEREQNSLLFYGYEPSSLHGEYALAAITSAPFAGECAEVTRDPESQCPRDVHVHVAWTDELVKASPGAAQILARIGFEVSEVNGFIKAVELDGRRPSDVAREWMARNWQRVTVWRG